MLPKNFYICSGYGIADTVLNSFDNALYKCGIGDYNHIAVSSILPPLCMHQTSVNLPKGSLLYSAYSHITSNDFGKTISATVAVGIPIDENENGVIMEHAGFFSKEDVEYTVRNMALSAMEMRKIKLREIIIKSATLAITNEKQHTAFACISMW